MRKIEITSVFKRDYKRESKDRSILESIFVKVVTILANDQPLNERYQDHPLIGDWKDHRDYHLRPDLILI